MVARDPKLLAHLEGCAKGPFEGLVHRVVWSDRSPIQGSSRARGRWNDPGGGFEILNTSLEADGACAEFEAFWSLFEQRPDRPASSWRLRVGLKRVVELDFEDLEGFGVLQSDYRGRDYGRTGAISDVVSYLGCDGLIVPSARYDGRNLVVYLQNLDADCRIEEVESSPFSWSD